MSSAKDARPTGRRKATQEGAGDPELVDRLRRAVGAYQLRTGRDVTWRELGEAVGLTPSSMNDVLSAKRKVTIREAQVWADHLGVEFSWLAIDRGPMMRMSAEEAARFGQRPTDGEPASDFFARRRSEAAANKKRGRRSR